MQPFNGLPSDSPVIFMSTRLPYLVPLLCVKLLGGTRCRVFALCLLGRGCGCVRACSSWAMQLRFLPVSLPRPTSTRYWRFHGAVGRCSWIRWQCPGQDVRNPCDELKSQGPKGDHHVRKPRSRTILSVVYN